jgi:glutamate racemase
MEIEAGHLDTPGVRAILKKALNPMLAQGIDTVVLGCTHFPFVIPVIEDIVSPGVRVIDPAPAVARQVARLLDAHGLHKPDRATGVVRFLTTGDPGQLQALLPRLVGEAGKVERLCWEGLALSD